MDAVTLLGIALALSMDAFAVALATGISLAPLTGRRVFRMAFHFGLFQALMPIAGWTAGRVISDFIGTFDHWVAFGLLLFVGGKMIFDVLHGGDASRTRQDPTRGWDLVLLSIATSIDALAVGLSMALLGSSIIIPALVIGVITASLTAIGMLLGRKIGNLWGKRVEVVGGLILIAIGVNIVVEHLTA